MSEPTTKYATAGELPLEEVPACPVCGAFDTAPLITTPPHMYHDRSLRFAFSHCPHCDTGFLSPRVAPEGLGAFYPSYYLPYRGPEAWGRYAGFVAASQRKVDRKRVRLSRRYGLLQAAAQNEKPKVLDVGCGNPTFLAMLHQRTGWQGTGIDFKDEGWRGQAFPALELIEGDVQQMDFARQYDLATMWHYLEHDYAPHRTLQAVHRSLKPGGRLIVEVPDYRSLTARWQKAYWEGWHAPRHTLLYSKSSFQHLLAQNGFRMVAHYRYGTLDAFTLWWMGEMERKQIDWRKPMDSEFWPLVGRKVLTAPFFALERFLPLGLQTVVAEAL